MTTFGSEYNLVASAVLLFVTMMGSLFVLAAVREASSNARLCGPHTNVCTRGGALLATLQHMALQPGTAAASTHIRSFSTHEASSASDASKSVSATATEAMEKVFKRLDPLSDPAPGAASTSPSHQQAAPEEADVARAQLAQLRDRLNVLEKEVISMRLLQAQSGFQHYQASHAAKQASVGAAAATEAGTWQHDSSSGGSGGGDAANAAGGGAGAPEQSTSAGLPPVLVKFMNSGACWSS